MDTFKVKHDIDNLFQVVGTTYRHGPYMARAKPFSASAPWLYLNKEDMLMYSEISYKKRNDLNIGMFTWKDDVDAFFDLLTWKRKYYGSNDGCILENLIKDNEFLV